MRLTLPATVSEFVMDFQHATTTTFYVTDYNAPLTENGGYTDKYDKAAQMIAVYDTLSDYLVKPEKPEYIAPKMYNDVQITEMLDFHGILEKVVSPAAIDFWTSSILPCHLFSSPWKLEKSRKCSSQWNSWDSIMAMVRATDTLFIARSCSSSKDPFCLCVGILEIFYW